MTSGKNYNSIVFLTTLSVYLGLVLVGGTPPVLAHAAMTRHFDIQTEVEVKDDLDKKPDDEKIDFPQTIADYYKNLSRFIGDLQKLHQIEKYDKFEISESGFISCNVAGDPVHRAETTQRIDNRWLEPSITDAKYSFENWNFLSDCLKDDKFKTGVSTSSNLKLSYDNSELKVKVSAFKLSQQRAEWLRQKFNQAVKIYEIDEDDSIVEQLHKFTTIKSENNQVFIITNLPRASIGSLFANKNAQ